MAHQSRVLVSQPAQALVESARVAIACMDRYFRPRGVGWRSGVDFNIRTQSVLSHRRAVWDQYFLHLLWTPLFFNLRRPDWALIEVGFLWLSVATLMIGLAPYSSKASLLLLPYLLWVAFAAYLNLVIVRMNAPFGSRALIAGNSLPQRSS